MRGDPTALINVRSSGATLGVHLFNLLSRYKCPLNLIHLFQFLNPLELLPAPQATLLFVLLPSSSSPLMLKKPQKAFALNRQN